MTASKLSASEENGMNRKNAAKHGVIRLALALFAAAFVAGHGSPLAGQRWACYGGDPGGSKYSPLKQVNRENVGRLRVA